ncbi:uncharacterized protein LOC119676427 [Teleopsis dalmanni]|uniref:uncharacterized protein LOC119676427 n=1 Tax=Teleopsis dalmanni TaxID=139649 RepID=UPI0018CD43A8|nr:uncharacterized protein LOC119676427 [Teleopsis dalmanni]
MLLKHNENELFLKEIIMDDKEDLNTTILNANDHAKCNFDQDIKPHRLSLDVGDSVKYVSELSTVRDCATECVEKEVWETQTFCCDQDGCNGANELQISKFILILCLPIIYMVYSSIGSVFKARR